MNSESDYQNLEQVQKISKKKVENKRNNTECESFALKNSYKDIASSMTDFPYLNTRNKFSVEDGNKVFESHIIEQDNVLEESKIEERKLDSDEEE